MNREQRRNAQRQERLEEKHSSSYVSYDTRYVPRGTDQEVRRVMLKMILLGSLMTVTCLFVGSLPVGILAGDNYYLMVPYLVQLYASVRGLTLGIRLFRDRRRGLQEIVYSRQVQRTRVSTLMQVICSILLLIFEVVRLSRIGMPSPAVVLPVWIVMDLLTAGLGIFYQKTLNGITFDKKRQK